ncbi:MAG TPA: hypothetical protein VHG71_06640 [Verrucomicrobiae bacterium]|nr:hypothetical protein [Verrucomicrobiae bacterium]
MRKLLPIFFLLICISLGASTFTFNLQNAGQTNLVSADILLYTNGVYFAALTPSPQSFSVGASATATATSTSWFPFSVSAFVTYQPISSAHPVETNSLFPVPLNLQQGSVNIFLYPGGLSSSVSVTRTVFNYETTPVMAYFKQNGVLQYQKLISPSTFVTYTYSAVNPSVDTLSWGYDTGQAVTLPDGSGGLSVTNLLLDNSGSYSAGNDVSQQSSTPLGQQSSSNLVTQGPISYQSGAQTNIDMAGFNMLASQNNQMLLNQQQALNYWTNAIGQIYAVRQDLEGRVIVVSNISGSMGGGGGSSNVVGLSSNVFVINWPTNAGTMDNSFTNIAAPDYDFSTFSNALTGLDMSATNTFNDINSFTNITVEYPYATNVADATSYSDGLFSSLETDMQNFIDGITDFSSGMSDYYPAVDMVYTFTLPGAGSKTIDFDPLHNVSLAALIAVVRQLFEWGLVFLFLQKVLKDMFQLLLVMEGAHGSMSQQVTTQIKKN